MKQGKRAAGICLVVSGLLCGEGTLLWGVTADNPYGSIVVRNAFGLKPPSPAPVDPSSIKPPPPKVTLNGITTVFGTKKAILKMTPPPEKGQPAKEQGYILSEGQRDGELEVIQINENAGSVLVNDYGTVTNLTFDVNGPPKTATASTSPAPAFAPAPTMPASYNPAAGGMRSLPARQLRLGGGGAPAGANNWSPPPAAVPEGTATSGANLGGMFDKAVANAGANSLAEQQTPQGMSPEAIATMIEAQRVATQADVAAGKVAPMPYTQYTPQEMMNEGDGNPAAQPSGNQTTTQNTSPQNQMPLPGRARFRPF